MHNTQTLAGFESEAAPDDSGAELVEDVGAVDPYLNDFNCGYFELSGEDTGVAAPEYNIVQFNNYWIFNNSCLI